jgi:hypothetical protein
VLMADGFNTGPSTPDFSWGVLEYADYPFLSTLRASGRDVVLIGFTERSASILDNAEAAIEAIRRANAQKTGNHPLTVGGFSMGGLVTRYALAKLETDGVDNHQTAVYFSYDSPHTGAYIPISLQAFAHYTRALDDRFSKQINSPAARQLLGWHIAEWQDTPDISKERADFLTALDTVGGWPRMPRLLGIANGVGTGAGNGIGAGLTAVRGKGALTTDTDLRTQPVSDSLAAVLRVITDQRPEIHAPGIPDVDGAPGGTLDSFKILADVLNQILFMSVENPISGHCFVPAVSAAGVRGITTHDDLYTPIAGSLLDESPFDDFRLASQNEEHTKITEELCTWLIERLP